MCIHITIGLSLHGGIGRVLTGLLLLGFGYGFSQQPNVVFFLVDDLGWKDLGCYGSTFYDSPRIDSLAKQSLLFTHAYAASPVCSPTRAAIMTGKHPVRVNITDWIPGMNPQRASHPLLQTPEDLHNLPLAEITLAEAFKGAGYTTFFAGKWHLGETAAFWPEQQGFDINKGGNHKGSPTFPGGNGYYAPYNNPRLENGPAGEYLTDRLASESIQFIKQNANTPFFLFLSFYSVHTPIQGCHKYDKVYQAKRALLPGGGQVEFIEEGEGKTQTHPCNASYAAMVRSVDENVGRVLDALEDQGLRENTLIIFTSDNGGLTTRKEPGPTSVRPLRAGKGWCYEGGIRIPTLIYAPGYAGMGQESGVPIISMDFYPTLLELAGLSTHRSSLLDGRSLVPLLEEPNAQIARSLIWHYPHYHGSMWRPGSALRKDNWKLVYHYETQKTELYNLNSDIGEKLNLAGKMPERTAQLREELLHTITQMGGHFPQPMIKD